MRGYQKTQYLGKYQTWRTFFFFVISFIQNIREIPFSLQKLSLHGISQIYNLINTEVHL